MTQRVLALLMLGLLTVACHDGPTESLPVPQLSITGWTQVNVTSHPAHQSRPAVAGDRVAWWDPRTPQGLYWWDGADVSPLRLYNAAYQWDPVGSRRWVVFTEFRPEWQPDHTIKWYGSLQSLDLDAPDPASTVRAITSDAPTAYYQRYDISGDVFAYEDHGYADPQGSYVYDLAAGHQAGFYELFRHPRISVDLMIATGYLGNPYHCVGTCLIDLTTGVVSALPVSAYPSPFTYDIDGQRVVFRDWEDFAWVLDLSTGAVTRLSEQPGVWTTRISGDYVAWVQLAAEGGYDIRLRDLMTGDAFTLWHSSEYTIDGLDINGTRIAWGGWVEGNRDIFVADLATGIVPSVEGVKDAITDYMDDGSIANAGVAEALQASLDQVAVAISRGNTTAARNKLAALINFVAAQSGKHIDSAAADALIDAVRTIIEQEASPATVP